MTISNNNSKKDSNIPWLGEIPQGWEVRRLKMLSNIKRGASPRPIDDPKYFDDNGEFAWVRISDVTASDTYLEKTDQQLSELGASLSVKQYPGDLFLSIAGTVGKPIFAKIKCCIHDGFVTFSNLNTAVNRMFLFYILNSRHAYFGLGKEGSQLNLNIDTVGNISIPLPPLQTQTAIVEFLDQKTAKISEFIKSKKELIELLKEQKKSLIYQAVTKGLDKNAKLKDSGIAWLGNIPQEWEVVKAFNNFDLIKDQITKIELNKEYVYHYSIPSIQEFGEAQIENGKDIDSNKFVLSGKELLISKLNPRKSTVVISKIHDKKAVSSTEFVILKPKNIDLRFSFYLFSSFGVTDYLSAIVKSATYSHQRVNPDDIYKMWIPLPPLSTQQAIVDFLDEKTAKIEETVSTIEQEIELVQECQKSLIYQVVTGKITV